MSRWKKTKLKFLFWMARVLRIPIDVHVSYLLGAECLEENCEEC